MFLTSELDAFARNLVASGEYGSVEEVMKAGVRLMQEQRRDMADRPDTRPAPSSTKARESFLLALGDLLRPMGDPSEIVAATTRVLGERLAVSRVVYADIDEAQRVATTGGDWTDGTALRLPSRLLVSDFGAQLIEALETGETLVVPDVRVHPATAGSLPALDAIGVASLVSVPLIKDDRFAADLNVHNREVRSWAPDEVELIEAVAERTWEALARARATAALAEREHELQMLTDAMPVLVSYVDADRRYRFINKIYEEWFPRRRDEIIGKPVREVVGETAYAAVQPYMDRVLAGERLSFAQLMPYAGTVHRHIEVEYVPRIGTDGLVEGFYSLVQDVSRRKVAEMALQESEATLREFNATLKERVVQSNAERNRIWSMSRDLFAVMGFDGYLKAINPAWESTLGLDEATLLARPFPEQVHPDDLSAAGPVLERLARGEMVDRFEDRLRHADGSWRWISWTLVPDGAVFYAVGRDVTAERENAADLARRTAERDQLWTLSEDMLARADYGGMMSAVSPAWGRVLGWSEADLLSRPYATFMHPDDMEPTLAGLARMGETGQPTRFENRIAAVDGTWRPIEWTVVPEADGANFIAVGRDLSVAKAREEELAQVQDALRQSQKMEAVGQLTGGIAHDFNNLLQGITGSLDLVQKRIAQGRTSELDRFVSGAVTSANRAAALTHRLLAFARRQPLDPKPVGANPLLASMEDLLRRTLGETMELELVLAGGLWLTLCDANQLESAVLNLAINARDAMPEGGKLTIETGNAHLDSAYAAKASDVRPGQYVCLSVTDTGTGMPPEVIERAFDPFFTTKAIGEGTGLGLSMIYGFARQSEGYAKIYSELGQGTTVKLYLPRYRGATAEEPALMLAEAQEAQEGEVVVVVEDEPVVRGLIVETLAELGYRALEAHDGPSGVALLEAARRVDLLITDIGLPGLNGRQVADAGRVRRPKLKVLFMTGYAENAAVAGGFLEPGMSMLTKPFAMEALATRIRNIIEGE
jgi:PAS domain S-box-containing protein